MKRQLAKLTVLAALTMSMAACSVIPQPRSAEAIYDFGPLPMDSSGRSPGRSRIEKSVIVHEALAPAWLDVPAMHYRLAQSSPAQPRSYANSRWVMSPAALFTQRLKSRLAETSRGVYAPSDGVRADLVLRLELEEFAQVFDSGTAARGAVRVRATLVAGREAPVQRTFTADRPAATPDADGGAKALIAASDEAVRQIVDWAAAGGKGP